MDVERKILAMKPSLPRIIINARPLLGNLTGVGQVTAAISRELETCDDFNFFFATPQGSYDAIDAIGSPPPENRFKKIAHPILHRVPYIDQIKRILRGPPRELTPLEETYDLYWEPNFIPLDTLAARQVVTTVHDMSWSEHPEWHPRERTIYFEENFARSIHRADAIVAVSKFTRDKFLEAHPDIHADRLRVIPCGVNPSVFGSREIQDVEKLRTQYELPVDFILCVGSLEPRKNLLRLLDAFSLLPKRLREAYPLVLVGDDGWKNAALRKRVEAMKREVRTIPYISTSAELALMYNAASIFVYPSLYEGFGIPPLEAMSCGTPVCLSDIPVFREIYPPETGRFVDPLDPESIAAGLETLLEDTEAREQIRLAGAGLAQRYLWSHSGEAYANLFRELC